MGLVSVLIAATGCTNHRLQAKHVPSIVRNVVNTQYPGAHEIKWTRAGNLYEAEVSLAGRGEISARIDVTGNIILAKEELTIDQLLSPVKVAVARHFPGYVIDDIDRLEINERILYQVELQQNGMKDIKAVFLADGERTDEAYWK